MIGACFFLLSGSIHYGYCTPNNYLLIAETVFSRLLTAVSRLVDGREQTS